ncbi:MAG: SDR family oxidoreductase [Pyrinomonadaceae bacterium]|nr:SDR family oxidoreductase [Pyrinomonadaceae bacterium]
MKVLFIGGTGCISSACSELAIERGFDLYLLNRGETDRKVPESAKILRGDIRDINSARIALGDLKFDVVVDWIAFTPEHIETDLELFRGRANQFIFISSASAYQTPPVNLPITESTLLSNPFWKYSRDKIACEERLIKAYREENFPITIVRPSHTYDETRLPLKGRYTVIDRMRKGKKVIVHGDGTSIWVLTHHTDFAKGFVGILGNNQAIGEVFHITSDFLITWNEIYEISAKAAGTNANIVHIPSEILAKYDKEWGAELSGDKAHSMIFDNSKIKRVVPDFQCTIPFSRGIEEIIAWHDADVSRQIVDEKLDQLMDKIIADWEKTFGE